MISNEKAVNYNIVDLIGIYNFASSNFSIWGHLYNFKKLNFKFERFKLNSGTVNDFKWKSQWDLQLWDKVCFHPNLFEKVMNFVVV
jgi:hypothetical protein